MNGRKKRTLAVAFPALVIFLIALIPLLEAAKPPKKPTKTKTPKASELVQNSVYQNVPTSVFANPSPDNEYFLSGWVCPGSGSALLTFVSLNAAGKIVDSAGIEVASSSELTQIGTTLDAGITQSINFSHPDYVGENFQYHRIYAKFNYTFSPPAKETRIILQNTSNEPASCSVWFDGIQLEKAFDAKQTLPTTYHFKGNLLSPEFKQQLEGGPDLYEW